MGGGVSTEESAWDELQTVIILIQSELVSYVVFHVLSSTAARIRAKDVIPTRRLAL